MRQSEADKVVEQIKDICRKHNLWFKVETESRPETHKITIKEISMKVDQDAPVDPMNKN